jgi:hypothetical protein
MSDKVWVYDLEMFRNFFSGTFFNLKTEEVKYFVIHSSRDDRQSFMEFLNDDVDGLIGFNNVGYDYPLLHFLLKYNKNKLKTIETDKLIDQLYHKGQEIINTKYSSIRKKDVIIPQLDLYKLHHYDGANKRCSLKVLEFSFRWKKLQDLPFKYDEVITEENIDAVLEYNLNDVMFTYELYKASSKEIQLRKDMGKRYKENFINYSDTKIGTSVIAKMYEKKTGIRYYDFKDLRDKTKSVCLGDLVWDGIKFNSKPLQELLYHIRNTTVDLETNKVISTSSNYIKAQTGDDKDKFKIPVCLNDTCYDILLGGLHSTRKPEIFEESEDEELIDLDFGSFYPFIMIMLKIFPPQLGIEMLEILKEVTDTRLEAKKKGDKVVANSLKICINSVYGNLGNKYSFLSSNLSKNTVTINGQLILLMLIEQLELSSRGIRCFYGNTDGATFKVKKDQVDNFYKICKDFEKFVNIPLEFVNYHKCMIRDVNNYLIITNEYKDGNRKIKVKGDFERVEDGKAWHKNHSMNIVAQALYEYYVNGAKVEKTIKGCKNIFEFLKVVKSKGKNTLELHSYDEYGNLIREYLQKTNRYYVSKEGKKLMKIMPPLDKLTYTEKHKLKVNPNQMDLFDFVEDVRVDLERESNVEAGSKVILFNDYIEKPIEEYGIDYEYYIDEAYKIINVIEN